jgi:hypothetical protein
MLRLFATPWERPKAGTNIILLDDQAFQEKGAERIETARVVFLSRKGHWPPLFMDHTIS